MILKALFARDSLKAGMFFLQNSLPKHTSPLQEQHTAGWLHSSQEGAVSLTKERTKDLSTIKCPLFNDKYTNTSLDSLRSVPNICFIS